MRPLMRYLVQIHQHRHGNLGGRTRVSTEGLHATFTALDIPHASITEAPTLQHVAQDLRQFIPVVFAQTDFDHLNADLHLGQVNLLPIKELAYFGLDETAAPLAQGGTPVSPQQFHQYLAGTITGISPVFGWHHHGQRRR